MTADAWEAAHLQMIFFPTTSPREHAQDWFRELTGEAPKESVTKPHDIVAVGPCGNATLNLTVDLVKIVFLIQPQADPQSTEALPTFSVPKEDAIASLLGLAGRWLDMQSLAIKRIGFAGRFIRRTRNRGAAYRLLKKYLPALKLDAGSF